jgi:hypothetical protein
MSSLYFKLKVFCQFEANVLKIWLGEDFYKSVRISVLSPIRESLACMKPNNSVCSNNILYGDRFPGVQKVRKVQYAKCWFYLFSF